MPVQESLLGEPLQSKNMHEPNETRDETLSFSDLPLYKWEDLEPESQDSGSISSSEQDYFEFSSQELTTSPPENLIFCGKIIPYRKPDTSENASSIAVETKNKETSNIKKTKEEYKSKQHGKGYKFPMRVLTSGKARWYLFLFGVPKVSTKMEMGDIKSRQSRHGPPPSPTVTFLNHRDVDDEVYRATTGVSGLIRILICGGNHNKNTMLDQSISRNRLE